MLIHQDVVFLSVSETLRRGGDTFYQVLDLSLKPCYSTFVRSGDTRVMILVRIDGDQTYCIDNTLYIQLNENAGIRCYRLAISPGIHSNHRFPTFRCFERGESKVFSFCSTTKPLAICKKVALFCVC
jgi:hypothetical protein